MTISVYVGILAKIFYIINRFSMLYKFMMCFVAATILSGCASDRLSKKDLDLVESRQKAVAVLNCNAVVLLSDPTTWFGGPKKPYEFPCNTIWRNNTSGEEFIQEAGDTIDSKMVYTLAPGEYSLSGIHVPSAAGYSYTAHNLSGLAKFEVKGGEVVYLGDVMLNIHQSAIIARMLEISDRQEKAKILMQKTNPQLAGRLTIKPIVLSKIVEAIKKTNLILNSVPSSQK